jgi:hypothetical protein
MNRSEQPRPFRPRAALALGVVVAAALLLLSLATTAVAEPGNDNRAPVLEGDCARLRVEAGNKVAAHAYAVGVQIYRWTGTTWSFVGPEAVLYHDPGANGEMGTHYAGPTWESNSGSKVVGAVVDRCTPDPTAIPWLLLRAVSSEGPGIFHRVTFIQRVNTVGGLAPAEPGEFVGEVAEVPYAAEYYFYRAHD